MAGLHSPNSIYEGDRYMDNGYTEAFQDFQTLQTLTASLIFRILQTRHSLEERFQADDSLPTPDALRLQHADEMLVALQRIKDDTDLLILNFNRPPKTFFEANIDQSRLIARLSDLLPSLHPFLPVLSTHEDPAWAGVGYARARGIKEEISSVKTEDHAVEKEEVDAVGIDRERASAVGPALRREYGSTEGVTACFDRGLRSRSVVPSAFTFPERESKWAAP